MGSARNKASNTFFIARLYFGEEVLSSVVVDFMNTFFEIFIEKLNSKVHFSWPVLATE